MKKLGILILVLLLFVLVSFAGADEVNETAANESPIAISYPPLSADTTRNTTEEGKPGNVTVTAAEITEILNAHNAYRSELGIPNLVWSNTVAASAQGWADYLASGCYWYHSSSSYGENLAYSTYSGFTWTNAVNLWGSEKVYFIYGPFGDGSSTTGHWEDVGHYTQIIWQNTLQCGCGKTYSGSTCGRYYFVCQYNPPGNYWGQYPYTLTPAQDGAGVFRPSASKNWIVDQRIDGTIDLRDHYGSSTDKPLVGDFNNDGSPDRAVFRSGDWILDRNMDGSVEVRNHYGQAGDIPLVGQMNIDSITDRAVFRSGDWIIDRNMDGSVDVRNHYGQAGDIPLIGDFNNDGTPDRAVFRPSTYYNWIIDYNMDGSVNVRNHYGGAGDKPLVGDINLDGYTDRVVFRNGEWIIDYNVDGSVNARVDFGMAGDIPFEWNI